MNSRLFVIITVDVEDPLPLKTIYENDVDEEKSMIYGKIDGKYFGFQRIMEICNRFNVRATFFLDILEYNRYSEETFKNICQEIKGKGHDVQLHIHPDRGYDENRQKMLEYSRDEQVKIIGDAKRLMKEWTGEYPIAYRGGSYYSINENSLDALRINKIPIDSTMFYGQPNCKVAITKNKIIEYNGIIEIPVTVFKQVRRIKLGNRVLKQQSKFIKTDIDWASLDKLKWFVHQAKKNDIKVMNLFMHSHSLLMFNQDFTHLDPDWNDVEKLNKFLDFVVNDSGTEIITMKQFHKMYQKDPEQFIGSDYVPVIEYDEPFNLIKHSVRRAKSIIQKLVNKAPERDY